VADSHKNFAVSAVATAPSPAISGTSLVVTAGHGTRFPTPPFNATVWPASSQPIPSNAEIVRVTGISTDTLTITRAQESSSARTVVVGDQIAATITAKTLTDVENPFTIIDAAGDLIVGTGDNAVTRLPLGLDQMVLVADPFGDSPNVFWQGQAPAIHDTIMDAKGDLIAASAADTPERLAVGANGKVLTAASGEALGVQWATPTASAITNVPAGNIAATDVQAAVNELDTEKQPLDSDLTAIAALAPTNDDIVQRKAGAWANRTMAQLITDLAALGTTFQALDATLTALAAANWAANALPIGTGADTLSQTAFAASTFPARASSGNLVAKTITDYALTVLDDTDAATARATLGVAVSSINFVIDGGGAVLTTGVKGDLIVDFACTINSVTLLADQSGSVVVNIWKDTYANYPPVVGDKITASAPPTITTATKSQDATLTGWTTAITAGDTLRFNVDSVTTIQRVTLTLKVTRA